MNKKGELNVSLEAIARLEELVERLLAERVELQERNRTLTGECDRLVQDRSRVSDELDRLLDKLERLEGKS
jgi:predicted nuclease with TOPRIM domain